jgi:DNA repair protein RadC
MRKTARATCPIPEYRVQLVRPGTVRAEVRRCDGARDVADVFRAFVGDPDREHVVAMFLNTQNDFVGIHLVAVGTVNGCPVEPAEVYKAALLCNAVSVVLAHNHPSGEPTPSSLDEYVTRRLVRVGALLGIPLVDHVVVGNPGYVSLFETGRMLELDEDASCWECVH